MRRITVWYSTEEVTKRVKGKPRVYTYHIAQWRDHQGVPHKSSLGNVEKVSERAARAACRKMGEDFNTGVLAPGRVPSLEAWVNHMRAVREETPRAGERLDTTIDLYLLPHFGGKRKMDDVSITDAQTWLAWLRKQPGIRSEATVQSHVQSARAVWNAVAAAHPMTNPFRTLKVRVVGKTASVPPLTTAQVLSLIEACPTASWKALAGLCALAGLRRGEALAMTWDRVEWSRNRLRVPCPKTARSTGRPDRFCLLCRDLADVLKAAGPGHGPIVTITTKYLSRSLMRYAKAAGLAPWPDPFQGLRRWRSSTWKDEHPTAVVDSWLGHGPEIARKHYYDVPPHHYGQESELVRLRREVAELRRTPVGSPQSSPVA